MTIKVLVIDDDPSMTALLELFLIDERFSVQATYFGADGVKVARSWRPDIIVLDLMMPNMSGLEVCRQIRLFSQSPILILSVVSEEELLNQALADGANGYLKKPITKNEIVTSILSLTKHKFSNLSSAADLA